MASSPVTAPAPKLPSPPPHDSSPPPNSSPPPILQQADSSQPPVEAATSPPPPPESPPPPPPDKAKSPPPDDSKSPPAPESKSPPPPPLPTPTPPAATLTPPPTTTSPPPVITPPPPSSPPPPALAPPTAITQPPPLPTSSPPPPQTSQNPVLILSPPLPFITPPSSVVFPPPQLPTIPTPSSPGAFLPPPNAPPTHRTPSPRTPSSSSNDGSSSSSSHNDLVADRLPLIIGITAGVGLLFLTMIVLVVVCSSKKKKKGTPMNNQLQYYGNPPPQGSKGAMYYDNSNGQHPNWYNNNPQMMDYQGNKIGPPQGLVVPPPGAAWGSPQPITSSSEMGSNLSDPPQHMLPASPNGGISVNKSSFSYDELAAATNGFSQANLIGQGGFGYVHKGVLPNDKVVAVKSLKSGSGQGEREFQAEVEIISRVHHRHLVSLVGYCSAGGQRMLVYEFVPNKTLEYHLHGKGCPTMEWSKRLKIAMGAAKGLAYLHEDCHPRIIHRDIKAANILIDNNFEAMVADFGLAKLSSDIYTHVSTRIMGTFGYLAPEYASSGKLTEKSDVFSFGVMLLELITGRRPVDTTNTYMEDSLVDWARPILTHPGGDYHELVDSRLEGNYDISEMSCMVACASASIRHSARRRPKMSQIVRALEGDVSLEMLNEGGVKPGQSSAFTTSTSTEYEAGSYNANMQKFRKMALGSTNQQEMGSTEYSGLTSTYGLNPSSSSDSSSGEVNQIPTRRPQY